MQRERSWVVGHADILAGGGRIRYWLKSPLAMEGAELEDGFGRASPAGLP